MRRVFTAIALAAILALVVGQTVSAAHAVLHHGSGLLKGTWDVDFDSPEFNTTNYAIADLAFNVVGTTNSMRYLQADTGAVMAKMGATRPSYSKCTGTTLTNTYFALSNVPAGTWFCMHTNGGHYVRFRLDKKHPYPGGVDLTYTTWV